MRPGDPFGVTEGVAGGLVKIWAVMNQNKSYVILLAPELWAFQMQSNAALKNQLNATEAKVEIVTFQVE